MFESVDGRMDGRTDARTPARVPSYKLTLRAFGSGELIIPKYGVDISNSLQDIRQNHWTMKYRSQ